MISLLLTLSMCLPQTPDSSVARVYAAVLGTFFVHPGVQGLLVRPRTVTGVATLTTLTTEVDFMTNANLSASEWCRQLEAKGYVPGRTTLHFLEQALTLAAQELETAERRRVFVAELQELSARTSSFGEVLLELDSLYGRWRPEIVQAMIARKLPNMRITLLDAAWRNLGARSAEQ